jgi:chromosome segregation ATPase
MSKLTMILSAVILALLALLAIQSERLKSTKLELKQQQEQVAGLLTTLTSKDDVIGQFEAAAKDAQQIVKDQQKALDSAAGRVQTLRSQLAESRKQLQALEEKDREIPECLNLLETPVSICPNYLDGMRDRASGLQGQAGGSAPTHSDTGGLALNGGHGPEVRPSE